MRKRICVITGTRAEYGLLYPLLKELSGDSKNFKLEIITTGMHLSREFGLTYKEIEKDGFKIIIPAFLIGLILLFITIFIPMLILIILSRKNF